MASITKRQFYDKDGRAMPNDEGAVRLIEGTIVPLTVDLQPVTPPRRCGMWGILSCGLLAFLDQQTEIAMHTPQRKRR